MRPSLSNWTSRSVAMRIMVSALALSASLMLGACATVTGAQATARAITLAHDHEFSVGEVEGLGFRHSVFGRKHGASAFLWVFIEGDGTPWTHEGSEVAVDPTARNPLALRIALQTEGSVLYLGRPCYLQSHLDARCSPSHWTTSRYSSSVVASMNTALGKKLADFDAHQVIVVGYSGGGTLAELMARDNPAIDAVVTIAANLDVTSWSEQHGYLPLAGSRNPADEEPLAKRTLQLHLIGGRDANVTEKMTGRYLARLGAEQVWRYEAFDHVCCWEKEWPVIQSKIERLMQSGVRTSDAASSKFDN